MRGGGGVRHELRRLSGGDGLVRRQLSVFGLVCLFVMPYRISGFPWCGERMKVINVRSNDDVSSTSILGVPSRDRVVPQNLQHVHLTHDKDVSANYS